MKIWLISMVAIVLGSVAGVSIAHTEFTGIVEYFEPVSRLPTSATVKQVGEKKGARVVVEGGTLFQFDTISFGGTAEHIFVVRNEGTDRLTLDFTHPSCGACIVVADKYHHMEVPPGESADVVVTYKAMKASEHFDNSAYFNTNDPLVSVLKLDIKGTVTQAVRATPTDLAFGTVSVTEGAMMNLKLLGYQSSEFELVGQRFSDPKTAEFFDISMEKLSKEEAIAADKHAISGLLVHVKIKPGLSIGALDQLITFQVRSEGEHNLELRVSGEAVGDITVMGKPDVYSATQESLLLGINKRGVGKKVSFNLLVKGPYRRDVKLSVGEVDPANALKVTIAGEGTPVGNAIMHTLNVELLKDAPAMSRVGTAIGAPGTIIIETTHPTAKTIPIRVKFAVE